MRRVAGRNWIPLNPLPLGQFNLARKRAEMLHQTRHKHDQTLIPRAWKALVDRFRDRVLIDIAHLHIRPVVCHRVPVGN
jgi:hypothetical protein